MAIIVKDGAIVTSGGRIATDLNCCCSDSDLCDETPVTLCKCGATAPEWDGVFYTEVDFPDCGLGNGVGSGVTDAGKFYLVRTGTTTGCYPPEPGVDDHCRCSGSIVVTRTYDPVTCEFS